MLLFQLKRKKYIKLREYFLLIYAASKPCRQNFLFSRCDITKYYFHFPCHTVSHFMDSLPPFKVWLINKWPFIQYFFYLFNKFLVSNLIHHPSRGKVHLENSVGLYPLVGPLFVVYAYTESEKNPQRKTLWLYICENVRTFIEKKKLPLYKKRLVVNIGRPLNLCIRSDCPLRPSPFRSGLELINLFFNFRS